MNYCQIQALMQVPLLKGLELLLRSAARTLAAVSTHTLCLWACGSLVPFFCMMTSQNIAQ